MANPMQPGRPPSPQRGFTYVAVVLTVAVIGVGFAATSEVWSQSRQREKEQELLFVGNQFRQAIRLYYERTPGPVKRYPEKLEDLLEDRRYPSPQRYLRKVYPDPLTGAVEWGLVAAPGGGIMGVHSLSNAAPIKTRGFAERDHALGGVERYSDWQFFYNPDVAGAGPPMHRTGARP